MRTCMCVLVVSAFAAGVGAAHGAADKDETSDRIAALIKQLGDASFASRQAASKELESLGAKALDALKKAATGSDDAEVRTRAAKLVEAITDKSARENAAK